MCNLYLRKSKTIASRKLAECNGDESLCDMCPSSSVLSLNICSWPIQEIGHFLVTYTEDWPHQDELKSQSPISYIDQLLLVMLPWKVLPLH